MKKEIITPIILLNWNGWVDTIACLKSLFSSKNENFCILIADNNSSDNSISHIVGWLETSQRDYSVFNDGDKITELQIGFTYLFKFIRNYGFAKGNNKVIESIIDCNFENVLLLNNDTEVTPDFLSKLIAFKKNHPEYKVLTPMICYYDNKNKIWNAGGKIFSGFRKYFYAGQIVQKVKLNQKIDITFITGCALFFQKDILVNNHLFTERFFFGEEDFEFSTRMKKDNIKMACVTDSIIYHKVSSSTSEFASINKIFIYYLNRFIDVKLNTSPFYFLIWKHGYMLYIFYLLKNIGFSTRVVNNFIKKLYVESVRLNEVSQETFSSIIGNKGSNYGGFDQ